MPLPVATIHIGTHVTMFLYERGACRCGIKWVYVEGYWNNVEAAQAAVRRGDVGSVLEMW